jgi:uncharacterized protein (TIGR03435 family)
MDSDRYDIDAKVDDQLATRLSQLSSEQQKKQLLLMLQSLLSTRFSLKIRYTTENIPIYGLRITKSGAKLSSSESPPTDEQNQSIASVRPRGSVGIWAGKIVCKDLSMTSFAQTLAGRPEMDGRPVVDETGLNGHYDFTLVFAAEDASDAPSIFEALREQLGLEVKAELAPSTVVVITDMSRPTEN